MGSNPAVAHQMIALLLGNNMILSLTEAPSKKLRWLNGGNRPALRAGLLPPSAMFCGISSDFCHFQEVIWSAWLRAETG